MAKNHLQSASKSWPRLLTSLVVICSMLIVSSCMTMRKEAGLDATAVAINNRGVALMGQFNFDAAHTEFERLALDYPAHGDIRVNLAVATLNRQQEGDEQLALTMLQNILASNPENLRAKYLCGLLELHRGRAAEALVHFEAVIEADRDDLEAWYFRGQCMMDLSRYKEAFLSFQRVIDGEPFILSAYYGAFMALRHLDKATEAVAMMDEFQRLKANPRARSLEFKYMKMGRKSEVVTIDDSEPKPQTILSGVPFMPGEKLLPEVDAALWSRLADAPRTNISICDINSDGLLDIFIPGSLQDSSGAVNALLLRKPQNDGYRLDRQHPLALVPRVNSALWGDLDDDGLTDLYLARDGFNQIWRQVESNNWQNQTATSGAMIGDYNTVDAALFDADHDGDLDIFIVNSDGPNELINNNRDGSFRFLAAEHGLTGSDSSSRSVLIADLDRDRDLDLILLNENPPHEVYLNDRQWQYRSAPGWEAFKNAEIAAALVGDVDADGYVEIYTLDNADQLQLWNVAQKGVRPAIQLATKPQSGASGPTQMMLSDLNGDGVLELLGSGKNGWWLADYGAFRPPELLLGREQRLPEMSGWSLIGSPKGPLLLGQQAGHSPLLFAAGQGRYPFAGLKLSGITEPASTWRSNASGIGNQVAARVSSRWTVLPVIRNSSGPGQGLQPLMIGLGGAERLDFVSIDWSDGVYQTELDLDAGRVHEIAETQRQMSSCPVLFVWDGTRYQFVSDLLGVGGIGYAVGPGQYAPPRPWEKFILPQNLLKSRGGRFHLKLTEPMEEITYLDAARLTTYDLPPGWQMALDERMAISGPEPTGQPFFYRHQLSPQQARNDRGEDVTASVIERDLRAAPPGPLDRRFIGRLEKENILTLTFPADFDEYSGQPLLLADGWVEYPYSQTNFAAWQAGETFQAPSIEVRDEDGHWQLLLKEFGYPAGMQRQMSVLLPPIPKGSRELRIRTNQEIYWDRLAIAFVEPCPEAVRNDHPLLASRLSQIGFPQRVDTSQHRAEYDYYNRKPLWDSWFNEGYYTRFGEVDELVGERDGALAIFGGGEEISLEFAGQETPLRSGWSRYHLLEVDGWCKDMDLFTKNGETVEPLPGDGQRNPRRDLLHQRYNTRYQFGRQ